MGQQLTAWLFAHRHGRRVTKVIDHAPRTGLLAATNRGLRRAAVIVSLVLLVGQGMAVRTANAMPPVRIFAARHVRPREPATRPRAGWPHVYLRATSRLPAHNGPQIYLAPGQQLPGAYPGARWLVPRFAARRAEPLSLASNDFNHDGVDDLLVGYSVRGGGAVAVHLGNLDAFAPQSRRSFRAIRQGRFPSPFLPDAQVLSVPVRPDFIATGTFTRQGYPGFVIAAHGGHAVYIFGGDGSGRFGTPRELKLPGAVTDLAAGTFGSIQSALIVGVSGRHGHAFRVLVYGETARGLEHRGSFPLRGPASSISFGDFGDSNPDAAFLSSGRVMMLRSSPMRLASISLPVKARALALGSFIFDRRGGTQLSLLTAAGSVAFAVHSGFDPRPYTAARFDAIRRARLANKTPSLLRAEAFSSRGWKIVENIAHVSPFALGEPPLFFRTRVFSNGADDVMVLDAHTGTMTVISHPDTRVGMRTFPRTTVSVRAHAGSPVAALSLRVNVDGRPGVVTLVRGQAQPDVMLPLTASTITVNDPGDPTPVSGACNGSNDCSLREAILRTNADTGNTDTIDVPAGTYTLSRPKASGDYSGDTGALYVNNSVNIVGAGQGSTFVQAGTVAYNAGTPNGVDMVMAVNEDISPITNATASISNLTLQNGNNRGTSGGDGDGGCMEFDTGSNGTADLTLTNVTLQNCDTTQGNGGGLVSFNFVVPTGAGMATITNSTIQGNQVDDNSKPGPNDSVGGGIFVTDSSRMSMTNSQVLNNLATQTSGGSGFGGGLEIYSAGTPGQTPQTQIHASTISGNKAAIQGGGIFDTANLLIDQGTVISGNKNGQNGAGAQNGGGLFVNTLPGLSTTLTNVNITGNSSTGKGGGIATGAGGGAGPVTISDSRLAGNTAVTSGGNLENLGSADTVTDNWWGTNSPAPTISTALGTTTFAPYIQLQTSATPTTVDIGGSSTFTTSFLNKSNGSSLTTSQIAVLLGLPVNWTDTSHGAFSNQQTTIQPNGQATATFTPDGSSCAGATAGGEAEADNVSNGDAIATATITVNCPDLTATKSDSVSHSTAFGKSWTWTIHVANAGAAGGTFSGGQTILLDNLPNASISYGSPNLANISSVTNGTDINCGIDGADDLSCTASGGPVTIAKGGSFDVTFTATPSSATTFANPRAGGACAADPNQNLLEINYANNACSDTVTVTDTTPPLVSNISVSPNPATFAPAISATIDDSTTGNSDIKAAEFFVDTVGATGAGTVMTPTSGTFDSSPGLAVQGTMPQATYDGLIGGQHTVYVHGEDSAGNWSDASTTSQTFTVPAQTNPAGSSPASSPTSVVSNGTSTSLLTVKVTPGLHPLSTGLSVTVDLSAIGVSATQTMYDDGTHGDVTASDGTYSVSITVPEGTLPQAYIFPVSIADSQGRGDNSQSITLTTTSPTGATAGIHGTTSDGTGAQATIGGTGAFTRNSYTATAQGGTGGKDVIQVAGYSKDPVDGTAPATGASYFDVKLSPHNTFTSVTIVDCALLTGTPSVYWYDQSAPGWQTVPAGSIDTTSHPGCATMTIPGTGLPSLSQLVGTVFAGAPGPTRALISRTWVTHRGSQATIHWRVASQIGIAGFYLTRGKQQLNRGLLAVHHSRAYLYRTRWLAHAEYRLYIVLRNGSELSVVIR